MLLGTTFRVGVLGMVVIAAAPRSLAEDPKHIVQQAVSTQLAADRNDRSHWRYIKDRRRQG